MGACIGTQPSAAEAILIQNIVGGKHEASPRHPSGSDHDEEDSFVQSTNGRQHLDPGYPLSLFAIQDKVHDIPCQLSPSNSLRFINTSTITGLSAGGSSRMLPDSGQEWNQLSLLQRIELARADCRRSASSRRLRSPASQGRQSSSPRQEAHASCPAPNRGLGSEDMSPRPRTRSSSPAGRNPSAAASPRLVSLSESSRRSLSPIPRTQSLPLQPPPSPPPPHRRAASSRVRRRSINPDDDLAPPAAAQLAAAADGAIHTGHGAWCPACRRLLPDDCVCRRNS